MGGERERGICGRVLWGEGKGEKGGMRASLAGCGGSHYTTLLGYTKTEAALQPEEFFLFSKHFFIHSFIYNLVNSPV